MAKRKATKRKSSTKKRTVKRKAVKRKPAKKKTVKKAAPKRKASSVTRVRIPPIKARWNPFALAYTIGILAALEVLVVSIGSNAWPGAVELMQSIYFSYGPTITGTIAGMAEAGIWGLIFGFLMGWIYNKFN